MAAVGAVAHKQARVRQKQARVRVTAPGRLHMGFLDLAGGLGRRFGSLGLCLEGVATRLAAEPAGTDEIAEELVRLERHSALRQQIGGFSGRLLLSHGDPDRFAQ